jgi:hypothetical protein
MPPRCSPRPSRSSCFRTPQTLMLLKPEDRWAPGPFLFEC